MILYHFTTSPFARRVRLALAHKGVEVELRDARADEAHRQALHRLSPLRTVPVLIDGERVDGERVVVDSDAIAHYLDRKIPNPPLWPAGLEGAEAFELGAMADSAIQILSDLGMRYYALHEDATFPAIRTEMIGRVQRALDRLAEKVGSRSRSGAPLYGPSWSYADMTVYTTVAWLEGLPARAATFPPARQVVELGWSLPASLRQWADPHRTRADVVALG